MWNQLHFRAMELFPTVRLEHFQNDPDLYTSEKAGHLPDLAIFTRTKIFKCIHIYFFTYTARYICCMYVLVYTQKMHKYV